MANNKHGKLFENRFQVALGITGELIFSHLSKTKFI